MPAIPSREALHGTPPYLPDEGLTHDALQLLDERPLDMLDVHDPGLAFEFHGAKPYRIGVIDDGRVLEPGAHDELVAAGGRYAEAYATWTSHMELAA